MAQEITPFERVVIIGCGDIGCRVGRLWRNRGLPVIGTARSDEGLAKITAAGLVARRLDLDNLDSLPDLSTSLVYTLFPPNPAGETDLRMQALVGSLPTDAAPSRIVHLSTTGVYGYCQGAMVTENDEPKPQTARGRRRLHGESLLRDWGRAHQVAVIVLRVGGIYGKNRLPLERIKKGVPVLKPELSPKTNRIHEDDLAQIFFAAALNGRADQIYNISDGQDSDMTGYFYILADHFHLPRPPAVDWPEAERVMSKGMLSYLKESRRLDNHKMLSELKVKLIYPSLEAWLDSQ